MKRFLALAVISGSSLSFAEGLKNRVALVVALDSKKISTTSISLYQEAEKAISSFQDWTLVAPSDLKSNMPANDSLSLGSISAIPNEDLKAALDKNGRKKSIKNLQAALDTLMADAAIIARCDENNEHRAKQCKLYYYDRTEQKIVASAGKVFTNPVARVDAWGISLASNLKHGLQEKKIENEKERIRNILQDKDDSPKRKTMIGFGAYNQTINDPGRTFKSIPGVYGLLGVQADTYGTGIIAGIARTTSTDSTSEAKLQEKFAGLQLSARTKALESIYWELAFGLIYNIRTVSRYDYEEEEQSQQDDRSVKFQFKPGLFWSVHENAQIGMMASYTKDTATTSQRTGYFRTLSVDTTGFGVEIGTRITF